MFCFTLFFLNHLYARRPKEMSPNEYALYKATYMGQFKKVERLIKKGVNPSTKSPNSQRTPLHIACSKGRIRIVECLVNNGAELDAKNIDGKTPLQFALEKGRTKVIKYLVAHGAHIAKESKEEIKKYLTKQEIKKFEINNKNSAKSS